MIRKDLHIHTNFCDGKDTPEEMVRAALDLNLETLGFSIHGNSFFDGSYVITKEGMDTYKSEIYRLKEKYRDKIEILCGVEMDYHSDEVKAEDFDYSIGSVHYVKCGDTKLSIDASEESFKNAAETFFNGDYVAFANSYFKCVGDVINKTKADIIGHFDLISKFNEKNRLFNGDDERYVNAGFEAIDTLIKTGKPFEINTGAISRGYRTAPYPSDTFLRRIAELGGKVILSSDSHSASSLCCRFEEAERMARDLGLEIV